MDTVAVTLIVKAPNQQIEDQTIKCELTWTIKKLKGYLSEVYPSKPSTDEQKLIYSGQLLPDTVVLKDILRQYEGQETHTVHLVCTQTRDTYDFQRKLNSSSATPKPSMASGNREAQNIVSEAMTDTAEPDGLRQRLNANGISAQDGSDVINQDGFVQPQQNARSTDLEQQMVWLQQTYSQYLYQYMQLVHMGVSPEEVYMQALQLQEPLYQGAPLNTAPPTAAQNPQAAHQHEQNNAAPVANLNNPVGGVAVNEEVEQDRDWLDWFYFMSRVMVLFSIVYFYSSPMRFLIVLVLGALIYLYQMGFFRNPTVEIHNEHAENVENNNVLPQVNVVGNPLNPPAQPAAAENANSERPNATNEQTTPEPDPPTIFALGWTFVSTFFASLIPDAPNAI